MERQLERRHLGCGDPERAVLNGGSDQGESRVGPLGQELAGGVHYHPAPVMAKAETIDFRIVERDPARALDGIDIESGESQGHGVVPRRREATQQYRGLPYQTEP